MYRERESERELASYICVQVQGRSMQITAAPTGSTPTCWIGIHVFLWRNRKNMNNVFRMVNTVYDMDTYIFKVNVFTKQANYE